MQKPLGDLKVAIQHVESAIPALQPVIAWAPEFALAPRQLDSQLAFTSLVESVISQQISVSAAATIFGRVEKLCRGPITARKFLNIAPDEFRAAGVSNAKTRTILELAQAVATKSIHLDKLSEMTDQEIVQELSSIWGIGKWTAEMFLMFELGRLDVWPAGDYGVRKGWQLAHRQAEMTSEKAFLTLGEVARPYRSVAAWYCWRQIEFEKA